MVYAQLRKEGVAHPVKELAARTGIPAGNLSMTNTGKRDMTDRQAVRISDAVPGISPADLGSDAKLDEPRALMILDRLAELEATVKVQGSAMTTALRTLAADVRKLERQLEQQALPARRDAR